MNYDSNMHMMEERFLSPDIKIMGDYGAEFEMDFALEEDWECG